MTKKRIIVICVSVLLFAMLCVGTMYALLMSRSLPIVNTFVAGDIKLTLTESTGSKYTLVPGCEVYKNPSITVKEGSVECWLFFKVKSHDTLDMFVTYSVADGWTPLEGVDDVFWRRVEGCDTDRVYALIKGDVINVSDSVTEEMLASLGTDTKLTFTAYAVQYEGVSTPNKAWGIIESKEDEV